jgi:hypothetical protein
MTRVRAAPPNQALQTDGRVGRFAPFSRPQLNASVGRTKP